MAIKINNKNVEGVFFGKKLINKIYHGALVVWEAIKSCFGSGYWINKAPWINSESWKN